jgi:rfaE bifunctional protein nucleotidyltransferase chain/domain
MLIFTNGCFDILHIGHVEMLKFCKSLGGKVVVGLNSDDSVKKLKGSKRPINNQNERKIILESIKYVDEVIIFDEETPLRIIQQLKPDIIVKGSDYKEEQVVGNTISKVVLFPYMKDKSTTNIIDEIKK